MKYTHIFSINNLAFRAFGFRILPDKLGTYYLSSWCCLIPMRSIWRDCWALRKKSSYCYLQEEGELDEKVPVVRWRWVLSKAPIDMLVLAVMYFVLVNSGWRDFHSSTTSGYGIFRRLWILISIERYVWIRNEPSEKPDLWTTGTIEEENGMR